MSILYILFELAIGAIYCFSVSHAGIYMRFGGLTKCYWSQTEYRNQYFPFMNLPNNKTVYQKFSRVHRSHQHHGLPLQAAAPAREYMGHKLYLLGVLNGELAFFSPTSYHRNA